LPEGEHRPVDERRGSQDEDEVAEVVDRPGEVRQDDPYEPEHGGLRDNAREERGHLRRRLRVRRSQPAVEREQRRLDGERGEEAQEHPVVRARADVGEEERALRDPERDDCRKHEERAGHREDHEGDGRLDPPGPAPHADEDVDRDQHRLEEDVEQDQVLRGEDADERADQEQHEPEVGARTVAARPGAVADRAGPDDDREPDEPVLEAVEADRVGDAELLEPLPAGRVLLGVARELEVPDAAKPEPNLGQCGEKRQPRARLARERQDPDEERARERHDDEERREHP
jgi:hypothetical protein